MIVLSFIYPPYLFLLVPRTKNCCKSVVSHTRVYLDNFILQKYLNANPEIFK